LFPSCSPPGFRLCCWCNVLNDLHSWRFLAIKLALLVEGSYCSFYFRISVTSPRPNAIISTPVRDTSTHKQMSSRYFDMIYQWTKIFRILSCILLIFCCTPCIFIVIDPEDGHRRDQSM
jgi:hypothetical protein